MRDLSASRHKNKKTAANRIRVQRKPLNLKKFLRPLQKFSLACTVVVVICGSVFAGGRFLGSATPFHLKNIEVSATKHLTKTEIMDFANIELGQDLLRINLKKTGEQLAINPWVETVKVRRYYPDTISISLTEREPLAVVNMGYLHYLDAKGTIFKTLNRRDRLDYPVVTGFSEDDVSSDPEGMKEALKSTAELLTYLRNNCASILADVSEIHYDKGYGFTLFTMSGALPIKVGSGGFPEKFNRLAHIYENLKAQHRVIQYIDLDYNDKIIVKS